MNEFRKQPEHKYCDYTLLVHGKEFLVHKICLASKSPYFDIMFSSSFKEGTSNKPISFGPETLKADLFEEFLEYVYTGKIDLKAKDPSYLIEMDLLAHMTEIPSLVELCEKFLMQAITDDTFYLIAQHAIVVNEKQLLESCKDFICQQQSSLTEKMNLSEMRVRELMEYYKITSVLKAKELATKILTEIEQRINKETFQSFCEEVNIVTVQKIKIKLKTTCSNFATKNTELLRSDSMKNALIAYTRLMTGLVTDP